MRDVYNRPNWTPNKASMLIDAFGAVARTQAEVARRSHTPVRRKEPVAAAPILLKHLRRLGPVALCAMALLWLAF